MKTLNNTINKLDHLKEILKSEGFIKSKFNLELEEELEYRIKIELEHIEDNA